MATVRSYDQKTCVIDENMLSSILVYDFVYPLTVLFPNSKKHSLLLDRDKFWYAISKATKTTMLYPFTTNCTLLTLTLSLNIPANIPFFYTSQVLPETISNVSYIGIE
jgi:hypothetical protein